MNSEEEKNNVKSGKELLDNFFKNILSIEETDKDVAIALTELYRDGKFTESDVLNIIREIREKPKNRQDTANQKIKKQMNCDCLSPSVQAVVKPRDKVPMGTKIKKLHISGLRGIKSSIDIDLDYKSVILYGDNATGKSSITDSLEWLYRKTVSHLSSEEIKLETAMKNSYIDDSDVNKCNVSIEFNNSLKVEKKLLLNKKNGKLVSKIDPSNRFLTDSENENLLIRYHLLRYFVDKTKTDKLKFLYDIIGFSEVTKAKDIFRKVIASIKKEINDFGSQINKQRETLGSKSDEDFIEKIKEKIVPLNLKDFPIKSLSDIDNVLEHIRQSTQQSNQLQFLNSVRRFLSNLEAEKENIDKEFRVYFEEFNKFADDVESIKRTLLHGLLKSGENIINKGHFVENKCPLCLQSKNIEELKDEIQERLKKEKNENDNESIKKALSSIKSKLLAYRETTSKEKLYPAVSCLKMMI